MCLDVKAFQKYFEVQKFECLTSRKTIWLKSNSFWTSKFSQRNPQWGLEILCCELNYLMMSSSLLNYLKLSYAILSSPLLLPLCPSHLSSIFYLGNPLPLSDWLASWPSGGSTRTKTRRQAAAHLRKWHRGASENDFAETRFEIWCWADRT